MAFETLYRAVVDINQKNLRILKRFLKYCDHFCSFMMCNEVSQKKVCCPSFSFVLIFDVPDVSSESQNHRIA